VKKLDGLQALRGFAAAYVLLFHLVPVSGLGEMYPWLKALARWGFAGVDLFFVLSGFVMWHTTCDKQGRVAARRFLLKRFARIYLGYWPWLAMACVMFLLLAPAALAGKNLVGSLLLLELDDRRLVISVAWSLAYEAYFYALFAGLMLAGPGGRLAIIGFGSIALTAFNFWLLACCRETLGGDAAEGFFFLSPFVVEFFAGSLAAVAYRARFWGLPAPVIAMTGATLAAVGVWLGVSDGALPSHQVQRLDSFGLAAVGLIFGAVALEGQLRWPRWSVALGDQSYSLYLGHPVLLSAMTLLGLFGWAAGEGARALMVAGAVILCALLASWLSYRGIERPLYRWVCRRVDR